MTTHLFAWDNYIAAATLSADSSAAGMGPANLQDDRGSAAVAWQTAAGVTTATLTASWGAHQEVDVVGLFRTNLTSAATITVTENDPPHGFLTLATLTGPVSGYGQAVSPTSLVINAASVNIQISDPTNPDGFLNIPLAFVGPAWSPLSGASYSSADGNDLDAAELRTRGGQEYVTLHWQGRRRTIALQSVRDSEMWGDLSPMLIAARRGSNVLYIPDTSSSYMQQQAIFGRLKQTADVSYRQNQFDRRTVTLSLTERL